MTTIDERLARDRVVVLDGGTGTELERRGVAMHDVAWCGPAMLEHGETVREVHADYIRAGAEVVITNTFATPRYMLEAAGLGEEVRAVNVAAVEAARRAREEAAGGREVWIAGSISHMAPGADYARRPSVETAAASFREQAEILAEAGVDFFALEMMRATDYARVAIEAAGATGLPVWVGFSCVRSGGEVVTGPTVSDEVPFAETVAATMSAGGSLVAVMHTDVEVTGDALRAARAGWSGPLGAYPHSGSFRMPHWNFDEVVAPEEFLEQARTWVALGARAVGGCCGIGPEHIRLLAERL